MRGGKREKFENKGVKESEVGARTNFEEKYELFGKETIIYIYIYMYVYMYIVSRLGFYCCMQKRDIIYYVSGY